MDRADLERVLFGSDEDFLTSIGLGVVLGLVAVWVLAPSIPSAADPVVPIVLLLAIAGAAALGGAGLVPIWLVLVLPTAAFFPPGCGAGTLCGPQTLGAIVFDVLLLAFAAAVLAILGYGLAIVGSRIRASNSNPSAG
jgi:hypothetical protein